MPYRRGDIVLVQFPFSGGGMLKKRPALIVQCDRNNERLANVIIAMVSSDTTLAGIEPTQFLIDIATAEGKASGLISNSVVKCENMFTIEQALVIRTLGRLSRASMVKVDQCLKAALGMP
ncbi:MAG TPA: type II toxin-antitoxin system PemK/MazF family toxin [Anaerolineae bacterium]|nr:type II toxin-antitoxin system PemK/MazF family toxin [Anaerolineae bacterium]HQI85832.1 type II toxin-antitoxin system PemK/MazF family toxin [Anaerolineae bacterium]